jgi:hypothetical protein
MQQKVLYLSKYGKKYNFNGFTMSQLDVQFVHKPLVQVKIYGVSVSLYPVLDASMSAAKRAHGFHVIKNNLLAENLTPRQSLNALGQQTGQSTIVDV